MAPKETIRYPIPISTRWYQEKLDAKRYQRDTRKYQIVPGPVLPDDKGYHIDTRKYQIIPGPVLHNMIANVSRSSSTR